MSSFVIAILAIFLQNFSEASEQNPPVPSGVGAHGIASHLLNIGFAISSFFALTRLIDFLMP